MKYLVLASLVLSLATSCGSKKENAKKNIADAPVSSYAESITVDELKEQLYYYASDEMEGRYTGEPGQKRAVEYLKSQYEKMGVSGGMTDGSYFQTIPESYFKRIENDSENVLAFIKGTEMPEEVLVLSAHLDHVGMEDGQVFNGADDDGSGTIALLEIAEAFKKAKDEGYGPKRSILFLHVTAEEIGLHGSRYYSENPVYPLENTIANLNIDMIGRIDPRLKDDPNYVYLIGSDMLSQDLHDMSEMAHKKYNSPLKLDYKYNGKEDPNRFYYRSDHYNFAKNDVPVIFYFNGTHEDYHRPSDTPDKIEYELYQDRIQLIFYTAWELANAEKRPALTVTD
ncbi:peptidase M28 [Nonlabens spongiae]|uniref:Peptidase M28 n=1 Tax=Nonlabens spongiae TaxID=331648 RepID=A0A1W6MIX8_9FLAO|nr:M28 family metallopeptidase [Nonlabens spongiae]ARN77446.1 peptidase M28 [Nonlabens spongiae]